MIVRNAQSLLALARSSADFMSELRSLIAVDARVTEADILSIHCGVVELTDRFDVDALTNADTLVVRLRSAPPAALSRRRNATEFAASASSGGGADADPVAASDEDIDCQIVPSAKRAKRSSDK